MSDKAIERAVQQFVESQGLDAEPRTEIRPAAVLAWTVSVVLWTIAPPLVALLWRVAW